MMLLIWFNPQKNSFYFRIAKSFIFDKEVGYTNQFNHVLVQMLYISKNKLINCHSFLDYCNQTKPKESKKNVLIDGAIHLLYKLKK